MVIAKYITFFVIASLWAPFCYGKKGSEPIYQDPFDIAGGGASLTRASQDAIIYSNPALMPLGSKFYRYSGFMPIVFGTPSVQESVETLQAAEEDALISTLFETEPLQLGTQGVFSTIFKNFAFGTLQSSYFDLEAKKHGSAAGGPSIDFEASGVFAAALSGAVAPTKWFSLGVTTKYVYKTEPVISIPITDQEAITALVSDPESLQEAYAPAAGFGADIGMLFFLQGRHLDYNLALKVDDIGGSTFSCAVDSPCEQAQDPFLQVVSVGQSIVIHGSTHAIILALDYRDVLDSYKEKMFKKVHVGMKVLLQQHLGLALGVYHGVPTYGFRVDLFVLKFGLTRYAAELTNSIGEKRRDFYMGYLSVGW